MTSAQDDLVIFVHGTYANDEDECDRGTRWWQRDSDNWKWFDTHLPEGTSLPDESIRLLHWNGENSQVDRLEASNRLLALMLGLEAQGRGYHLVGHSHGGSIIWEALISAEVTRGQRTVDPDLRRAVNKMKLGSKPLIPLRDDEYAPWWLKYKTRYIPQDREFRAVEPFIGLPGLRSWTTVGTPFLHHLPRRRFLVPGWTHRRFSLNPDQRDVTRSLMADSLTRLLVMAPFFYLFGALFFFGPPRFPDNWLTNVLSVLALVIWVTAFATLGNRNYADALIARERAGQRVMHRFHDRWLGLWAPEDEAIAALKRITPDHGDCDYEWLCTPPGERATSTVPKADPFLADKFRPLKVPVTDAYLIPHVLLLAPARIAKPAILAINRFALPAIGRGIARVVWRNAHGANLPRTSVAYASPWPLPLEPVPPGLPPALANEIQCGATEDAERLGTEVRKLFFAWLEGLADAREIYEGSPLVHTSYFDHEELRRLVWLHIARNSGAGVVADDDLAEWLMAYTEAVQARIGDFTSGVLRMGPPASA